MAILGRVPRLRHLRRSLKSFAYSGFARGRWQFPERVLATLSIAAGDRVADLGAGAGYFTFRLARAVGPEGVVYAVDADRDMLSLIAARAEQAGWGNVATVEASPDGVVLPGPVDLVLLVNAFHHLPDPSAYLGALVGQLGAEGRIAVIESRPRWFLFGHATESDEIRTVLAGVGLQVEDDHDFLPRQSFQVFARGETGAGTPGG